MRDAVIRARPMTEAQSKVLEAIRSGCTSRPAIAKATGLDLWTASNAVERLKDLGLVTHTPRKRGTLKLKERLALEAWR